MFTVQINVFCSLYICRSALLVVIPTSHQQRSVMAHLCVCRLTVTHGHQTCLNTLLDTGFILLVQAAIDLHSLTESVEI